MFNVKKDDKVILSIDGERYQGVVVVEQEALLILSGVEGYMGERADGGSAFAKLTLLGRVIFNKSLVSWVSVVN